MAADKENESMQDIEEEQIQGVGGVDSEVDDPSDSDIGSNSSSEFDEYDEESAMDVDDVVYGILERLSCPLLSPSLPLKAIQFDNYSFAKKKIYSIAGDNFFSNNDN